MTEPNRPRTPDKSFDYGWVIVLLAAAGMVATLPGRTQGLGLITEPMLRDLPLDRVQYAHLNLWATLLGAPFCLVTGRLMDRFGGRVVVSLLLLALGITVLAMSAATTVATFAVCLVLTRGFGQSALSAASISLVGLWFQKRLPKAMATYSIVLSVGFMLTFPLTGFVVDHHGWRTAWLGVGLAVLALAPVAAVLVRRPPAVPDGVSGVETETGTEPAARDFTLLEAAATPAFWVVGVASAVYLLVASGIGLFNESILGELGFPPAIYHRSLAVGAVTALAGNFLGGWLIGKRSPGGLLAAAMLLLSGGLLALPHLRTVSAVMVQAVVMGLAGGFVTVLFFTFWRRFYGRTHLGQIQGAAQMMTVVASAVGPIALAQCHAATGSYAFVFRLMAGVTALLAVAAWVTPLPGSKKAG